MTLSTLTSDEVAVIGRAIRLMASGEILEAWEFGARIGVEPHEFRIMFERWPAWDDAADDSPECVAVNNTLNELLNGVGISERHCRERLDTSKEDLLRIYRKWATARGWSATGVK